MKGFEILPIEPDDEDKYDIIRITSPEKWQPHKYKRDNKSIMPYDPTDLDHEQDKMDYPATLNHISKCKSSTDSGENFKIPLNISCPMVDT